ncbi:MAG: 5-bromo-4-chloroindolyl phosphate hydrolysis family protein [Oscillospiraceae bacterium]|nr:5-bromo-4-chloroindolyl phosphate hydrolysis family protein [Oscillospiraceae bacterium]
MDSNKKAKVKDMVFGLLLIGLSLLVSGLYLLAAFFSALMKGLYDFFLAWIFGPVGSGYSAWFAVSGLAFGIVWVVIGIKALLRAERSSRYERIIGAYPRFKISDVAKASDKSLKTVSADLKEMKKRGYFVQMAFDLENKELVFAPDAEPLPQLEAEEGIVYKENRGLPVTAFVAAAVTAAAATPFKAMMLPALAAGVCAFLITLLFFPAPVYFTEAPRKTPAVKKPSATGDASLDAALSAIYESKSEFVRLSTALRTPKIREPLKELLRILDEIAAFISENPEKAKGLRQFVNYYLPTTVNFLKTYEELDAKPDKGGNITETLRKIEGVTEKMTGVFKREYDELFSDKAMDVSAEISVMQSIIKESENNM